MNSGIFVLLPTQTFEMGLAKRKTKKTIIYRSARNGSTGEQFEAVHPAVQKCCGFCYCLKLVLVVGLNSQTRPGCQFWFSNQFKFNSLFPLLFSSFR